MITKLKTNTLTILMTLILILTSISTVYANDTAVLNTRGVSFSGGSRNVSYITIDLNDSSVDIQAAISKNQIGTADSLQNISNQFKTEEQEVLAAINGTFFSAYDNNPLPWGTIQKDGKVIHIGNTGSVIGFTQTNEVKIENLYIAISGSINESGSWYAWNINHPFETADAVTIFTPEFGKETHQHSFTTIVVKAGKVSRITVGKTAIPTDGYVIVTGVPSLVNRFKIGDAVDYDIHFSEINFQNENASAGRDLISSWKEVTSAIGAGPTLIKNGVITANGLSEGFFEDEILTNRGQRSFIGVTKENKLVMGTVPSVSVKELAEIAKELGLYQAINLDGGASSGLIYKDRMVHAPGRLLSNAIVITKKNKQVAIAEPAVRVQIDGKYLETEDLPMIIDGRTMIPFRAIFNALDAEIEWDEKERVAIGMKDNIIIRLPIGKSYTFVNEEKMDLDVAASIINGRTYIPTRFVAESLGARVDWDAQNRVVYIWSK
ncbi:copper amine oxidase domain protein [Alkaliphilus metalliredigens QYMF]|uniref:Copper amine oxidase domain protein n=1 Tax=Alkaliphilus metalliredigens (strain QYMF) TaxID=293826 RepID=A6TUG6_ALKMQ|nr:stalk domain-containing protein [Alkaliphilus metalliredigens]ABR49834.1 copper amine oxidase domain protein [Alkaliphilus metalliredigens QYMF]